MIRNPNSGPMAWFGNFGVSLSGCLVLAFLLLPILIVLPLSFSDSRYMSLPLGHFTLRWYEDFFSSSQWLSALFNSFAVALASTALAVILGGLAALGLRHPAMPGKRFIEVLLIAPMIVPAVIVGVGMYFVFSNAGLTRTYLGLVLAHTTLAVPFVVVNVGSALGGLNQRLLWAAASMGATPWVTLRKVTLPLIAPGLISGGLFAFATSLDEVVVTLFLAGPDQRTLPREMFTTAREALSPVLLSAATIMVLFATLLLLLSRSLSQRS
ncbi:polyamine ABC transporter permease [Pseudomonas frederiksbergensis]|uniref:Polyamine ABC transporter permease n=1 Tax=Pseudomonas frederiksbergensis TaxID=104087 RepID=A0AB33EH86_9PSED|nr:ABC transporter permease [Pseudomonas frederiksbergensis]ATE78163.1 polyamine ABC transporter permease [Pseudomonas frederiksbergensis]